MSQYVTHPLVLFLAVWSTIGALYFAGVSVGLFPVPHALTVGVLLVNVVAFSLGYMTWTLLRGLPSQRPVLLSEDLEPGLRRQVQRVLPLTLLMGVLALLLTLYQIRQMAAPGNTSFLGLLMNPSLLRIRVVNLVAMSAAQTNGTIMLISLTSAFFSIGFVLLGVFLRLDTTLRRFAYLFGFLIVLLATSLINLSRAQVTFSVLYLVLAYGMTSPWAPAARERRVIRDLLLPVLAVVGLFAAVEVLLHKSELFGTDGGLRGVLFSFYWYLASPLAAFNDFLINFHGDYTLGERTFAPAFKWLHRLHLAAPPRFAVFDEFVFVPHAVNVYTYLRSFYEDFGLPGVAVVPYVYGWLMAAVRASARRQFPYLNLYIILLVPVLFSFYDFWLLPTQFYMQILFGFLFFRYPMRGNLQP